MRTRKIILIAIAAVVAVAVAAVAWVLRPTAEWQPIEYGREHRERLPRMTLLNHEQIMRDLFGEPRMPVKTIGILVYDGVDTLEAIAPMAVFSELMSVKLEYVGRHAGTVKAGQVALEVERSIDEITALDVLIVPGGDRASLEALRADQALIAWLQRIDAGTQLTAGIGHGTVLLADAGVLRGRAIAFGWPDGEANAAALGATYSPQRHVADGKYWTSVGGTGALDVALAMLQAITSPRYLQAAMLDLEYDPRPPLAGGREADTPPAVLDSLRASTYTLGDLHLLDSAAPVKAADGASPLRIGILVYEGFFTLDAIGPLAVLAQWPGADVRLIRLGDQEVIKSGRTRLRVPVSIAEVDALDVLLVPGGSDGTWRVSRDPAALEWIRAIDQGSQYTSSVCTGSWILGGAGLLKGRDATSNWYRAEQMLPRYGARYVPSRYVVDGKYWTSAGVSAGIDLSFALMAKAAGEDAARQAMMRLAYRPEPPIDAGSPAKTDDLVLDMMQQMYDYQMVPLIRTP